MKIGEVCLYTSDVVRLADFYRALLRVGEHSDDDVHQFILSEGTTLTIYNDGTPRQGNHHNISLAFTVEDVDVEFERVKALGATIASLPMLRPWGAKNMAFFDPDGNLVLFRSFQK
ncbi:VOC family protein [Ruminococcaceae bacterium OttesenSCG-928-D13]|nr:VOC family protein [Ruminococcaceae bacterium OttesenSCG-928-D13]